MAFGIHLFFLSCLKYYIFKHAFIILWMLIEWIGTIIFIQDFDYVHCLNFFHCLLNFIFIFMVLFWMEFLCVALAVIELTQ